MATIITGPELVFPPPSLALSQAIQLPPKVDLSQEALQNPYIRGVIPSLEVLGGAPVLPNANAELAIDYASTAIFPAYDPLFSVKITTTQPSSFLWFSFTATWFHNGPDAGNAAVGMRFVLDGVTLTGGTSDNQLANQIGLVARVRRTPVTAGPHVLEVDVTHFGPAANTVRILAASFFQVIMHASLFVEEKL